MRILLVAATEGELPDSIHPHGHQVESLTTGVGIAQTALILGQHLARHSYDLIINIGIAGSLRREVSIGSVVNIEQESWGDFGAEDADGQLLDIFQLGLANPQAPPYKNGVLLNPHAAMISTLPLAKGLTVQKVHGSNHSIEALLKRTNADIESMEGAAFFLACLQTKTPFLAIRSISNYVESRNREAWNIPLALKNLHQAIPEVLKDL